MNGHLPESVRAQFDGFARRLRVVETAFAMLGAAGGLLAAYLVLFVSDRFWDTPAVLRVLLMVAGAAGVAAAGWYWARRWIVRRRDERQFAVMVQRRFPRLGDRLLGIVELADESKRPSNVSPELCRAALAQVAAEASTFEFQQAVPTESTRRAALIVGIAGAVLVAGLLAMPAAGWNALQRWLRPWSNVPRYTLVELRGVTPRLVVPYGEAFPVKGRVGEASRWRPTVARGKFDGQSPLEATVNAGAFVFQVPGQTRSGVFAVRVGDARARSEVAPMFRPELTGLKATIEFPGYLGYGATTQDVHNGALDVVEGARLSLAGAASRELDGAWWNTNEALRVNGRTFESSAVTVETNRTLTVEWQDVVGLRAKSPVSLTINAKPDQAPLPDFRKQPAVVAILEDEVLPVAIKATDDFGVKEIGVNWEGEGAMPVRGDAVVAGGGQQRRQVAGEFRFAPHTLGITPQMVTLRATAVDYRPGREPARSRGYRVLVLDYASHAQAVQREFEKLQEQLEEIARAEELAHETNRQLAELSPEQRTREKREAQEQMERANAERLRRWQEQLTKLLKEALRNRTIPESLLKEWAQIWERLEPLPSEWMPEVADSLRKGEMEKALARQAETLKRLTELLQQLQNSNEAMQAASFVQRLRQASETERKVETTMRELLPVTAGARPEDLPEAPRRKLQAAETQQQSTHRQVRYLRDDLGAFVRRSRIAKYREVHEAMEETQIVDELAKLMEQVEANRAATAIPAAKQWADQLALWADKLGKAAGAGSGQGQGGEMSQEAMELMMKLMRIRQEEIGIRETTRSLEERKALAPTYAEMARALGVQQRKLGERVGELSQQYADPQLAELLAQVGEAMDDATKALRLPDTGAPAIGAETEVIELLSAACNGQSQGGGKGSLAALMMRLGLAGGSGATGGGNPGGGPADGASPEGTGSATGAGPGGRHVEKASGAGEAALPEEFRAALESYFEQREKMP